MSSKHGWTTVQHQPLVKAPADHVPVSPAQKAAEAEALRQQIMAFEAAGGQIVRLPATFKH
ncbi:hypothetical protein EN794_039470 [Mesorhizobium sp. M00.F.Ca.ET.151.01.1.1]|nr:hypothetical protein EN842_33880 [bacterium M00.F.Ca.ET.199.01.1.1]TGT03001.1 hypothetical protein EN820_22290 [bacterium M00.F.Ca.ET.177.01.1.1]TGT57937.1 hypothetical protein EN813_035360 [Mesorhizobium sp. M00.F.Ca.ET.170.01.1.1]TGU06850.1 hypothetical protein EN806_33150 [bacterium M00.F.Ca.ET.163.01.1.1]TGU91551.1 hypothetical protein EN794_039470 [Mesorhizobium sp. M00.F.Ca.ET.151.01.1.1]TGV53239.1 hypothetical protein EN784_40995 [bacterium M00.F.Ca.ET.141.01.1.1]